MNSTNPYPFNHFSNSRAPIPLNYDNETEAIRNRERPSHRMLFTHLRDEHFWKSNQLTLDFVEWLPSDKLRASGPTISFSFTVLPKDFLSFECKVYASMPNIIWFLIKEKRIDVRKHMTVMLNFGCNISTMAMINTMGTKGSTYVSATFRPLPKGLDLDAHLREQPQSSQSETSQIETAPIRTESDAIETAPIECDSTLPVQVESIRNTEFVLPPPRRELNALDVFLPKTRIIVPRPRQPTRVEPVQQTFDVHSYLKSRTAEAHLELEREEETYRLKRAALQKELAELDQAHEVKRKRLQERILSEAQSLRIELEQQLNAFAMSIAQ